MVEISDNFRFKPYLKVDARFRLQFEREPGGTKRLVHSPSSIFSTNTGFQGAPYYENSKLQAITRIGGSCSDGPDTGSAERAVGSAGRCGRRGTRRERSG